MYRLVMAEGVPCEARGINSLVCVEPAGKEISTTKDVFRRLFKRRDGSAARVNGIGSR